MAISRELFLAILSMDAYNRGYNPGISLNGSNIGTAVIGSDELLPEGSEAAGFYAVAYEWEGETIISYRGTELSRGSSRRSSVCLAGSEGRNHHLLRLEECFLCVEAKVAKTMLALAWSSECPARFADSGGVQTRYAETLRAWSRKSAVRLGHARGRDAYLRPRDF